jgi:hypothetical protein
MVDAMISHIRLRRPACLGRAWPDGATPEAPLHQAYALRDVSPSTMLPASPTVCHRAPERPANAADTSDLMASTI